MSNTILTVAEYRFDFKDEGSIVTSQMVDLFFKLIREPSKVKSLLIPYQYKTYSDVFLFIEHQELSSTRRVQYVAKTIDVMEHIYDIDFDKKNEFSIGFSCGRKFDSETLQSIYVDVFIPLFQSINPSVTHTGRYSSLQERKIIDTIEYTL